MMSNKHLNRKGQSTIEFVLVMTLLMFIIIFLIQLAILFAVGNYVHYATFMSARALLSASHEDSDQIRRAHEVLTVSVKAGLGNGATDRWPVLFKGEGNAAGGQEGQIQVLGAEVGFLSSGGGGDRARFDPSLSWQSGVRYRFRGRLFMISIGSTEPDQSIELVSESWLGREPSFSECTSYMNSLQGSEGENISPMFDNGC